MYKTLNIKMYFTLKKNACHREGEIEDRNIQILHPINLYIGVSTRLAE